MGFTIETIHVPEKTDLTRNNFAIRNDVATSTIDLIPDDMTVDNYQAAVDFVNANLSGPFPGTDLPLSSMQVMDIGGNFRVVRTYRHFFTTWEKPPDVEKESFTSADKRQIPIFRNRIDINGEPAWGANQLPNGEFKGVNKFNPNRPIPTGHLLVQQFAYTIHTVLDHNPLGPTLAAIDKVNQDVFSGPLTTFQPGRLKYMGAEIKGFLVNLGQPQFRVSYKFEYSPVNWQLQEEMWDKDANEWVVNDVNEHEQITFTDKFSF